MYIILCITQSVDIDTFIQKGKITVHILLGATVQNGNFLNPAQVPKPALGPVCHMRNWTGRERRGKEENELLLLYVT